MDFYVQKKEEDKEEEPSYAERHQKRLREEDRAKRGDESTREKLFEKFANSILKVNEEIKPAKKNEASTNETDSSETDSLDSESEKIIQTLTSKGLLKNMDSVDAGRPSKKRKRSESSEEEDNKKTRREGGVFFEDPAVDPATSRGEEELEQRFRIDSVRDFHARIAEDVAKILEKKYPFEKFKNESEPAADQKETVKKMPAKSKGSPKKKKSSPKKKEVLAKKAKEIYSSKEDKRPDETDAQADAQLIKKNLA